MNSGLPDSACGVVNRTSGAKQPPKLPNPKVLGQAVASSASVVTSVLTDITKGSKK